MSSKSKYYVVWNGKETGIFSSWKECEKRVKGYPGALYKGFPDEASAREAFLLPAYEIIASGKERKPKSQIVSDPLHQPVIPSICVDAACSGNPGVMEYRGVETSSGNVLFYAGPFPLGTNNIGEFLAIVHALALMKKKQMDLPVYTDSAIALKWIQNGKAMTRLPEVKKSRELFEILRRAEDWLASNTYENPLFKWDTKAWGEIPADFGRK